MYRYVGNNPITNADPTGLCRITTTASSLLSGMDVSFYDAPTYQSYNWSGSSSSSSSSSTYYTGLTSSSSSAYDFSFSSGSSSSSASSISHSYSSGLSLTNADYSVASAYSAATGGGSASWTYDAVSSSDSVSGSTYSYVSSLLSGSVASTTTSVSALPLATYYENGKSYVALSNGTTQQISDLDLATEVQNHYDTSGDEFVSDYFSYLTSNQATAGNAVSATTNAVTSYVEEKAVSTGNSWLSGAVGGVGSVVNSVGNAFAGIVDAPGSVKATVQDVATSIDYGKKYGVAVGVGRQIGVSQAAEALVGADINTGMTVNWMDKAAEASGRLGSTAGLAAGGISLAKSAISTAQAGSSYSSYLDITSSGKSVRNVATDVAKSDFVSNLKQNGFAASISKDGEVTILKNAAGQRYIVRDAAKSTGGPTADYYNSGSKSVDLKIRLK